ncbi:MAG: hypothetical protein A2068_06620 [Ignavibacteria bacterium GWB2_35_6b]|nr:MAG: hypothetical protein A2068_06620 [Ignavibacteria bacterium GWB2_35_6b]
MRISESKIDEIKNNVFVIDILYNILYANGTTKKEKFMLRIKLDKNIQSLSELRSKTKVLEDIKLAEEQIEKGLKISHQDVKKRFSKKKVQ